MPTVADHELLRRIGGGSYGEVWLARTMLGHYRAVKIVRRSSFTEDRPFERELDGIRQFEPVSRQFESQVDILQVGYTDGGFYYVMELADDASCPADPSAKLTVAVFDPQRYVPKTLKGELARRGQLPDEECLDIALTLATALQHLHGRGLIHRDIKPSNIIFIGGVPKLADIGLVTTIDATHSFVGTEGYVPPEGPGTAQADLYSLGKVLYEISTGRPRTDFPEPPAQWSGGGGGPAWPEIFEVVLKACEPDPQRRYRSAREMRAELALLQSGKSVRHVHLLERRLATARRIGLVAGLLLLVVMAANLFVIHERELVRTQARRADQEATHARLAEHQAREELWKACLAQAQAWHWSGRAGRRFEALAALSQAAAIRTSLELRNEAIACLTLADLRVTSEQALIPTAAGFGDFDRQYQRYAFAETNGEVVVCRVSDRHELARLKGFEPPFPFIGFTPDGQSLAIACGEQHPRVEIWRLDPREAVLRLDPADGRTMDFTSDSRRVAISLKSGNCPILIYDLATGRRLGAFDHRTLPWSVRFHPQQPALLLTSDQTPEVRLWDWTTGRTVSTFTFSNWVAGIDWHPEGRYFAAAGADMRVWLWDTALNQARAALSGHQWCAVNVTFTHDGEYLASRGWDNLLCLWDFAANKEIVHAPIVGFIYDFGRANYKLGCNLDLGTTSIFEVAAPVGFRLLREAPGAGIPTGACIFSPDGRLLLSAHGDNFRLWDVTTGRELATLPEPDANALVAFAPDGKRLFTGTPTAVVARDLAIDSAPKALSLGAPRAVATSLDGGAWSLSADGRVLAFYSNDTVQVRDFGTGRECARAFPVVNGYGIALDANGTHAATWTRNRRPVEVWNLARAEREREIPTDWSGRAAFSPDNQWLVTCGLVEYRVWNLRDWKLAYSIRRGLSCDVDFTAFSPDARILAIALTRDAVRLVESATGRELATLQSPNLSHVNGIVFSPDGDRIAIPTALGPIQLWDLRALRHELARLNLDW